MSVRLLLAGSVCLTFPAGRPKNALLRLLGWDVHSSCRIGHSWISVPRVRLAEGARIGQANLIKTESLVLGRSASIGHLNIAIGPFWLILRDQAAIGNQNRAKRARRGVTWGRSMLKLGTWSKITSGHVVDCCRSVVLGNYSTVAGLNSQIWTHGYLHASSGVDRFRIDGRVRVGNNVYIGSACVINAGVSIGDAITVGAASCVARSLTTPGLYVSQPMRLVPLDYDEARARHPRVRVAGLVEHVVNKHPDVRE